MNNTLAIIGSGDLGRQISLHGVFYDFVKKIQFKILNIFTFLIILILLCLIMIGDKLMGNIISF